MNGQSIYMDDLVITQGRVDADMMREHAYNIVQIPRLDMEIAVCDQIEETTFVKKGTVGSEFWNHLSKDQLKERDDVVHVDRHSDSQWWNDISEFLSGNADPMGKKINVQTWINRKPKLDIDLVKESLLAHRQEAGEWLANNKTGADGKIYVLEYGPYAGQTTVGAIDANLIKGQRGLPDGSSIAKMNAEISEEYDLDYFNHLDQDDLDIELIRQSLLAHKTETGEWLTCKKKGADGKSYVLEHGPYAGQVTAGAIDANLSIGQLGLTGGSSIAKMNAEISEAHGLDYFNHLDQDDLDIELIKQSLLMHRQETGTWLTNRKKRADAQSYILEHGPYAGKLKVSALDAALSNGARGITGGSSIAKMNAEISESHGLDYFNHLDQDDLDIYLVKQSLLAHRTETGEWLTNKKKGADGKSYVLEHGSYAGQITAAAIDANLSYGQRSLPSGSSIAKLNAEISEAHGLDYQNHLDRDDLDIELIKQSLLAHWEETDEWLIANERGGDGKTYVLEHGPYAGHITASALNANLTHGQRGLPAGSSIFKLNEELKAEMENLVLAGVGADEEESDNSPSVE